MSFYKLVNESKALAEIEIRGKQVRLRPGQEFQLGELSQHQFKQYQGFKCIGLVLRLSEALKEQPADDETKVDEQNVNPESEIGPNGQDAQGNDVGNDGSQDEGEGNNEAPADDNAGNDENNNQEGDNVGADVPTADNAPAGEGADENAEGGEPNDDPDALLAKEELVKKGWNYLHEKAVALGHEFEGEVIPAKYPKASLAEIIYNIYHKEG